MRFSAKLRTVFAALMLASLGMAFGAAQQAVPIDAPLGPHHTPLPAGSARPLPGNPLSLPSVQPGTVPVPAAAVAGSHRPVPQAAPAHSQLGPKLPLGMFPALPAKTQANTVKSGTPGRRRMNGTTASFFWNQVSGCGSTSTDSTIFNLGCQIDFQMAYCNGSWASASNNCNGFGSNAITTTDLFQDYYINANSVTAQSIDLPYTPATNLYEDGSSALPSDCTSAATCPYGPFHNLTLNNPGTVVLATLDCGVPGAPAAPVAASAAGTLAAGTYHVKVTYVYASGETTASPETAITITANKGIKVTAPTTVTNATGWNVYISLASGAEKKQNAATIAMGTSYTQSTALLTTSASPPATQTCPTTSTAWVATAYITVSAAQGVNTYSDTTRLTQASQFAVPSSGNNTIYVTISNAQYSDYYVLYVENTSVYTKCTAIIPSATSLAYPCNPAASNATATEALATGPLYMQWTFGSTLTAGTYSIVAYDQTQGKRVGQTQVVLTSGSATVTFNGIGGNASPNPAPTGTPSTSFAFNDPTDQSDSQIGFTFSGLTGGHKYCFTIQDPTGRVYQDYTNSKEAYVCTTLGGTTTTYTSFDNLYAYKSPKNFGSNVFTFAACDYNVTTSGGPCTVSAAGSFNLFGYNSQVDFTDSTGSSIQGTALVIPKNSSTLGGLMFTNDGDTVYGTGNGDGLRGLYFQTGTYNAGTNTGYGFTLGLPGGVTSETVADSQGQFWTVKIANVNSGSNGYTTLTATPVTTGQFLSMNSYLSIPNITFYGGPGGATCTGSGCEADSSILPVDGQTWSTTGSTFSTNATYFSNGNGTTSSGTGTFIKVGVTSGCSSTACSAWSVSSSCPAGETLMQQGYCTRMSQGYYSLTEPFSPTSNQADVFKVVVTNTSSSNAISAVAFTLPSTYSTASYNTTWTYDAIASNPAGWAADTSASCPTSTTFCIKTSTNSIAAGASKTFYIDVQGLPPLSIAYAQVTEAVYSPVLYTLTADASFSNTVLVGSTAPTQTAIDAMTIGAYSLDSSFMTPLFNPTSEGTGTTNTVNVSFKNTSLSQDTNPDYVDMIVFEVPNGVLSVPSFAGLSSNWQYLGTTSGTTNSAADTDYWFGLTGCSQSAYVSSTYGPVANPTTSSVSTSIPATSCSSTYEQNALAPGNSFAFNSTMTVGNSPGTITAYAYGHGANANGWSKAHSFTLTVAGTSGTAGFSKVGNYGSPASVTSNTTPQISSDSSTTYGNSYVYSITNTSGSGQNINSAQIMIPYQDSSGANGQDSDTADCSPNGCIWNITSAPTLSGTGYTNCAVTSYTSATATSSNGYITIGNSGGTCTLTPNGVINVSFSMKGPYKVNDQYGFFTCLNGTWSGSGNTATCGGMKANETWVGDQYVQTVVGGSVVISIAPTFVSGGNNVKGNSMGYVCPVCTFTAGTTPQIDFGNLGANSTTAGSDIVLVDVYTNAANPEGWSLFVTQTGTNSTADSYLQFETDASATKSYQPATGVTLGNTSAYMQIPVTSVATSGATVGTSSGTTATRSPFEFAQNLRVAIPAAGNTASNQSTVTYTFIAN